MNETVTCPALNVPCDFKRSQEKGVTCSACVWADAWMNNELRLQQIEQAGQIKAVQNRRVNA